MFKFVKYSHVKNIYMKTPNEVGVLVCCKHFIYLQLSGDVFEDFF